MAIWGDLRLGIAALAAAGVVAGCGSASTRTTTASSARSSRTTAAAAPKPAGYTVANICTVRARDAVARVLRVAPAAVGERASMANSGFPQCAFRVRLRSGRRVSVTAEVDTEPSAYQVLERTIVEATQIFTPHRASPAPVQVPRLGMDASWFPEEQHLMTTDAHRVITATVVWPGVRQRQRVALAVAAARPYLGHFGAPHPILNPNSG